MEKINVTGDARIGEVINVMELLQLITTTLLLLARNIILDHPRTTNSAESWHNSFASIFHRHSPNPLNLVRALLDEQVF